MNYWPAPGTAPALVGADGELILLYIDVEPKLLEDFLDLLARLDFPVNPDLHHHANCVTVSFPAYSGRIEEIRQLMSSYGFDPKSLVAEHALATHA
jgi:hypothetical protein